MTDTVGITTSLMGTPGYMDPAYLATKGPTPALDVYRWVKMGGMMNEYLGSKLVFPTTRIYAAA